MTRDLASIAAQNNADWYAMMWDLRGLRYRRDAHGFCAIDPPPPYHGWVTAVPGAPIEDLIARMLHRPDFAIKDGGGEHDLSKMGLQKFFDASWIAFTAHPTGTTTSWEEITNASQLKHWEDAWRVTSPSDEEQFPAPILKRKDVRIWGRKKGSGYDAGAIANLSDDCVGLSNLFGAHAWPAATTLCSTFGNGQPVVGYERGRDLKEALAEGWYIVGPLSFWARPKN